VVIELQPRVQIACSAAAATRAAEVRRSAAQCPMSQEGKTKGPGTRRLAKPVCTWVGRGTAICGPRAVARRKARWHQACARAVCDALRCRSIVCDDAALQADALTARR